MGGILMGLIGCGSVIASKAMEGKEILGGLLVSLHDTVDSIGGADTCRDVAILIATDKFNKLSLALGIVIGANYIHLINSFKSRHWGKK